MPDFVGDDIGLGEIGIGSAEPLLQLIKERWVQIHDPVGRAVKRSDRRWRQAAAGLDAIGKENHVRRFVGLARFLKLLAPDRLGKSENLRGKGPAALLFGRAGALLDLGGATLALPDLVDNLAGFCGSTPRK